MTPDNDHYTKLRMGKIGKLFSLIALATGSAVVGGLISSNIDISWQGSQEIGSIELITVVLTALSIMLVILTIFLAALGFIGISTINDRLEQHSRTYFFNELKKGRPAFDMLKEVVREIVYKGIDPVDGEDEYRDEDQDEPSEQN